MTIEKEFFEAFGIEPKYQDRCALEDRCKEQGLPWSEVEKRCPHKMNCTDDCVDVYDFVVYPPITPEIVLGLEYILIKHTFAYINMEGRKIVENAPFGYIHKYGLYECHCGIASKHKIGKGKTRIDSLLNLCIQLKDEIQDQVRELFNAM